MKNIFKLALIFLLAVNTFAAQQTINNGAFQGDTTAERAYTAFGKINANFTELYTFKTNATNVGYVNVKAYGAIGDGVTDSTTAFSNALASGLAVYVPAGQYVIKTPITLTSGNVIFGDGDSSVIIQGVDMLHRSVFNANGADNIRFEKFRYVGDGYYSHGNSFFTNHALFYSTNTSFIARQLTITNQVSGLMADTPKSVLVENCNFQHPYAFGDVTNYQNYLTQDIQWYDIMFQVTPAYGVAGFYSSTNIVIRNNTFFGNHTCIGLRTSYDTNYPNFLRSQITATIENNTINSYGRYGILMYLLGNAPSNTPYDTNGPFSQFLNCVVRNNVIRNGSTLMTVLRTATASSFGAAIYTHAQDGSIFEGNQIYDCAQYMRAGTLGMGTITCSYATGITIRNNIISNTPANGISVKRTYGGRPNDISGNYIIKCGYVSTTGIAVNGSATVGSILSTNGFLTNDVIYVFTNNIFTNAIAATTKVVSYTADTITLANTLSFDGACTLVAPSKTSSDTAGIYVCDNNNVTIHDNIISKSLWNGIIPSGGTYNPDGTSKASCITNSLIANNLISDLRYYGIWINSDYNNGCSIIGNIIRNTGSYGINVTGQTFDNVSYCNNSFDGAYRGIYHANTNYQGLVSGNVFNGIVSGGKDRCIITGSTNCYNNLYTGYGIVTNKYW